MTTKTGGQDLDALFEVLADGQRRRVLSYLQEHGSATRTELADVLTGWLASDRKGEATPADHSRLELELVHVHVPKLQATGLVDYDETTDTVALRELEPWAERLVETAIEVDSTVGETTAGRSAEGDEAVVDYSRDNGG